MITEASKARMVMMGIQATVVFEDSAHSPSVMMAMNSCGRFIC
jgi:hypothetical protein